MTIERKGVEAPVSLSAELRKPVDCAASDAVPYLDVASLGIAYRVLNRVESVIDGSPAAKAGLRPDDLLVAATLLPPGAEELRRLAAEQPQVSIPLTEKDTDWPTVMLLLQRTLPGTSVKLTYVREEKEQTVTLEPVEATDWFNPDRGFLFEPLTIEGKADGVREACEMGGQETLASLTIVFRSLKKLSTAEVSPRGLAGPWFIMKMALNAADRGTPALLLFLTMLSANLAVLNFLPIPVLDGGHMVFLLYEGIRGKPANERVQIVLTYMGLILVVALMVWVMGLDFGLIPRH